MKLLQRIKRYFAGEVIVRKKKEVPYWKDRETLRHVFRRIRTTKEEK